MQHNAPNQPIHKKPPPEYVTPSYITSKYGIHSATLGRWADSGKVECLRMQGGRRIYPIAAVRNFLGQNAESKEEALAETRTILYACVGSDKQRSDLDRQIQGLKSVYPGPGAEVVSDVGSCLHWERNGFLSVLEQAHERKFGTLVVAHKDRLCRFAVELVQWFLVKTDVRLVVQHKLPDEGTTNDELAQDLLSFVNVFVARNNGRRSAANRKRRREQASTKKAAEGKGKEKKESGEEGEGKGKRRRGKRVRTDTPSQDEEGENISFSSSEEEDRPMDRDDEVDL